MSAYDLVIRGGLIVDGSGGEPFLGDVAVREGRIAAVGQGLDKGAQEIDATGKVVTPGFVDVHTHYDGHVTWEQRLKPSSFHGITTAVIGNCGVGFAPCRPGERDTLIRLMEGVEDIPFPVLATGLPWTWETYPEYLDFLASRTFDMDVACYVPHAALRVYVMGERGANREQATAEDIAEMRALFGEALDKGAIGIGTSRTLFHRSSDGKPIPTLEAGEAELLGFADEMRQRGKGVFQIVEDMQLPETTLHNVISIAERSQRPVTFTIGTPNDGPQVWRRHLGDLEAANDRGLTVRGQVLPRGVGMMLGHQLTLNPFYSTPTYTALAPLPLPERLVELRKPAVKATILSESLDPDAASMLGRMVRQFGTMFELGNPPNYEQPPENSIAARAAHEGRSPEDLAYDLLLQPDAMLYLAMANFTDGNLDSVGELMRHRDVVPGLGDGGAHCGTICDGSYSTYMLMHWVRDRGDGRVSLADAVRWLSHDTATLMGLDDRGLIAPGLRADINVIDLDALYLHAPEVTHDLPGGMPRLVQRAEGYAATIVHGTPVYRDGQPTGDLPGRLIRAGAA
ncbi:putative hydrolase [Caenibius tardaugens NBRC 16725]|uniref:Putative hydrolase n=1 Tax=Caenibius tardaugens NBRC 16725 TaxID=1219035 RepID=U3A7S0_9SPHN|nr:amidohydrolase family protein [Caenibius tardaugens]AZI36396.1 D-aminoacylase [Caenibius tardaugens NBRC 16725]GAD50793.1 putative hydrolase [Caenibius tardaugens NBRC 16725]